MTELLQLDLVGDKEHAGLPGTDSKRPLCMVSRMMGRGGKHVAMCAANLAVSVWSKKQRRSEDFKDMDPYIHCVLTNVRPKLKSIYIQHNSTRTYLILTALII